MNYYNMGGIDPQLIGQMQGFAAGVVFCLAVMAGVALVDWIRG
jgi:hypothetical protein